MCLNLCACTLKVGRRSNGAICWCISVVPVTGADHQLVIDYDSDGYVKEGSLNGVYEELIRLSSFGGEAGTRIQRNQPGHALRFCFHFEWNAGGPDRESYERALSGMRMFDVFVPDVELLTRSMSDLCDETNLNYQIDPDHFPE